MENWIAIKSGSIFTHVSINIFSDSICFSRFHLIERNTKRVKTVFCECDSLKIARILRILRRQDVRKSVTNNTFLRVIVEVIHWISMDDSKKKSEKSIWR